MRYATGPDTRRTSHLACIAGLFVAFFGIGQAQATVQYRFVPTSIEMNGVTLGPLRVYDVDFGVTDAAFLSGHASADLTCGFGNQCVGFNNGLVADPFFRNTIDVALRPDGLVDGSFTAIRASEEFALSGTGLLWSGLYASDAPYFDAAAPNQLTPCQGSVSAGRGCTITGYFLAEPVTTPGQGVPVPEPATAALVAVGLLALVRRHR